MLKYEKVAVDHDRCEKIQELSENVDKLKTLMKKNLGKFQNRSGQVEFGSGQIWVRSYRISFGRWKE